MPNKIDLRDITTLHALDANYIASFGILMGTSGLGEYCDSARVALLCCGAPMAEFNWAHLRPPFEELPASLERAQRYFEARELPYRVELRGGDGHDIRCAREALAEAGYQRAGPAMPGMALAPLVKMPPVPQGLRIEQVSEPGQLADFGRAAFAGFGFPVEAAPLMLSSALILRPEVQAFVGYCEGAAVASAMLITSGAVAGIYWVATVPDARKRGYGEALTWATVEAGRRAGCLIASLQASEMGRPVYARMGFEHVIDYERYERS